MRNTEKTKTHNLATWLAGTFTALTLISLGVNEFTSVDLGFAEVKPTNALAVVAGACWAGYVAQSYLNKKK